MVKKQSDPKHLVLPDAGTGEKPVDQYGGDPKYTVQRAQDIPKKNGGAPLKQTREQGGKIRPVFPHRRGYTVDDLMLMKFILNLTRRQRDVLELASDGMSNAEIAARLRIKPGGAAEHLTVIYDQIALLYVGTDRRPSRYLLIRLFSGFYRRHPQFRRFKMNGE